MKSTKENTFCTYPFKELTLKHFKSGKVSALGGVTPCCMMMDQARSEVYTDVNKTAYRLGISADDSTPEELFFHPRMDQLRKNMLSNVRDPACIVCWDQEDAGMVSHRLVNDKGLSDDEIANPTLTTIDVTHSNICNLQCRMCHPLTSHSLLKDVEFFKKNPSYFKDLEDSNVRAWDNEFYLKEATTTPQWKWLEENTDKITVLKASGGEPLYDNRMISLLKKYVETDSAKDTTLAFHTNATMFDHDTLLILSKFKENHHVFSIDGFGSAYDYIRHPAKFEDITDNIKRYIDIVDTNIKVAAVVSSLNLLTLDKYINWADSFKQHNPNVCVNIGIADVRPFSRGTNISRLPVHLLEIALDRIEKTNSADSQYAVQNLIQLIKNAIKNNKENKELMLKEIRPFDMSRSQSFKDFLDPLLIEWLSN